MKGADCGSAGAGDGGAVRCTDVESGGELGIAGEASSSASLPGAEVVEPRKNLVSLIFPIQLKERRIKLTRKHSCTQLLHNLLNAGLVPENFFAKLLDVLALALHGLAQLKVLLLSKLDSTLEFSLSDTLSFEIGNSLGSERLHSVV